MNLCDLRGKGDVLGNLHASCAAMKLACMLFIGVFYLTRDDVDTLMRHTHNVWQ